MFKFLFFAALFAIAAAKPGLLPVSYSAPITAYSAPVGYNGISAYSAYPAVSAYNAYPGFSAYSAYSPYSPVVRSVVGAPVVGAYSAGVPLAYSGHF